MASTITNAIRRIFTRRKPAPLVCEVNLEHDPDHVHTDACFIDIEPLTVLEFFGSQGCISCPPAIPGILSQSNHPNLLLLSYNVTLFDHLGWKDTFAAPQWDNRQRAYVKKWERKTVFTPMVVVNGAADGPGIGHGQEVQDIVARAREIGHARDWHIVVDTDGTDVRIDSDKQEIEPHDILVVTYDPQVQTVKVGKGPNKGKKLNNRNIVREVTRMGEWTGGNLVLPLPTPRSAMDPALQAVVLVQAGQGGPIVGAVNI
ncbi:DUF1223-domain-containing protein [Thozetella sp. PMI_491]|nr:DUF1223-domain-containing protein [Thozetella sp. PMI_491]